jgi:hypothetical protein
MKALVYLVITNIKNSIKELKKHPTKLIILLVFVALLAVSIVGGNLNKQNTTNAGDIQELYAGVFAIFTMIFVMNIMTGFSSGASFFSMADVNLMFLTPISVKKILFYGLIRQMSQSFLLGFFLFFQYSWLHGRYGVGVFGLFAILVGFAFTIFCAQLTSMLIYSFTNNNEKLKKALKSSIITVLIIIVALIAKDTLFTADNKLEAIISSVNSTWVSFIPVVGWVKTITVSMINLDYISIAISLVAVIAYIIAFTTIIVKYNVDFYEDVLQATEVTHSAITAKKQGKINDTPKNVKLGKTGISKGFGSSVFFHKHMLENRRSGGLIIDKTSIIFIVANIFFAFVFSGMDDEVPVLLPVFAFSTYMQIFSIATGRWVKELLLPYIYMIPESAFKKLLNLIKESILKIIVEAIIMFIIIGLVIKAPVYDVIFCIIARIGFGILFIAGNVLIERILGSLTSKTLIMFLYIIIMIFIAVPGFIVGFLLTLVIKTIPITITILCTTFIWNVLASSLIIYLCRDILNYAELNNR